MRDTKAVTVVHPDSRLRVVLRSILQAHGCTVATDHSTRDLMSGKVDLRPDLILLDSALLRNEGMELLSEFSRKWDETEIVFLPEGLRAEDVKSAFTSQLLGIIDRLLQMRTTKEMLAV